MTILRARPRFEYGNTRLRVRRLDRMGEKQLTELMGRDVDGLLGALASTALRTEAEAALARGGGVRRLNAALRAHEARELEVMRGFYGDAARSLVDLLLARFDLHNLLVLLRGVLRRADEEQVLEDIIPVGAFTDVLAREIVRQHEPAAALALLAGWELPDPVTARATVNAFAAYERDANLGHFESAVIAAHTGRIIRELDHLGSVAADLRASLARSVDETNVMALLRLRSALSGRELDTLPGVAPWSPGGSIATSALESALRQVADTETASILSASARYLRTPLEAWSRDHDLAAAQRVLEQRRVVDQISLFRRGDPMGIAMPIAYVAELELETRNLRVLAQGAALRTSPDDLGKQLLLPEARP
ncbi:V-type ATPase subunit [Arthrobacter sp. CG_A4]|uniref:V-type ATPase subunit n=1 Tax=Arthrobacter sp. CG_A4 TaxID=3071706 RepID=UPI002E0AD812|nr:V/A-type H+-transporting ATPase subunit C [Arthrobacter sp. CG_A4]